MKTENKLKGMCKSDIIKEYLKLKQSIESFNEIFSKTKFENHVIKFGKYKDIKLIDMVDDDHISWLDWYLALDDGTAPPMRMKNQYIFKWWLDNKDSYVREDELNEIIIGGK